MPSDQRSHISPRALKISDGRSGTDSNNRSASTPASLSRSRINVNLIRQAGWHCFSFSFQFRTSPDKQFFPVERLNRISTRLSRTYSTSLIDGVRMSDLKLGFKQAILQRIQGLHSATGTVDPNHLFLQTHLQNSFRNGCVQPKQPTDFSIKRILGDAKAIKDANPIDLSKSNQLSSTCNSPVGGSVSIFKNFSNAVQCYHSQQQQYQQQQGRSAYSENLVKPKVCKFWDLNSLMNCNGCDRYFKQFAFSANLVNVRQSLWGGLPNFFPHRTELVEQFSMQSVVADVKNRQQPGVIDDEISYKCTICDKVFGCAATLEAHERTHKAPRYECLDCGKGFSQLRNYKYHLSVHRGTKEFAAECPECGKTFNDKGYLSSHMKIHRNRKEYECPYCPKSFNQRVAFNMHVRIHTGVKPHKCTECGKRFSRKMLLKQHMRTHSGEKPYQCSVCGKSFADRSNMTLHHRLHSGIKPFTCPICPKAFTKKHHLKTHLNYHTGCKPYVCPHPNCNQAFTQSSNMRTHSKKCQFRPINETSLTTSPVPVTQPVMLG